MVMKKEKLIEAVNDSFNYDRKERFSNVHQRKLCENDVMMVELGNGDANLKSHKKSALKLRGKTTLGIEYLIQILKFYKKIGIEEVLLKIGYSQKVKVDGIITMQGIMTYKKDIREKRLPVRIWLAPRVPEPDFEKEINDLLIGKGDRWLRFKLRKVKKDKLIEAL